MPDPDMPTTIPSPADRGEFAFVATDRDGRTWRWNDAAMVCVRVADHEARACPGTH